MPPTEKRGRVHTSTVTVVVLDELSSREISIERRDLVEKFIRGSGAGGQHKNKTSNAVALTHKPSGLSVRVDSGRSQHFNRVAALELLRAKLAARARTKYRREREVTRRKLAGSGMRGDKVRTVQVRNDVVVDHVRGTRMSYRRYARGYLDELER